MTSLYFHWLKKPLSLKGLVSLCLLVLAALLSIYIVHCFQYMLSTFHYLPQADDYRLTLHHTKPFLENTWSFEMLWKDVHPNPIHGILLISSAVFEKMSFASLPYLLFPFLLIKWLLINQSLRTATSESVHPYIMHLVFIVFGFIVFGFNAIQQYVWNSVAIANIYHAMGALYILLIARELKSQSKLSIIVLSISAAVFLICCRQFAAPWVYATVVSSLMLIILSPNQRHIGFKLIAAIAAAMIFESVFYKLMGIKLHYDSIFSDLFTSIRDNWGHRLDELFKFSITEMAMPLIYPWFLREFASISSETLKTGVYLIGALYGYVFVISAIRLRYSLSYFIPIVILVFMSITILATVVYRTDANTYWLISHIPRYIVFRNIGIMAIIWVLIISVDLNKIIKWVNYTLLTAVIATLAWSHNIHYQLEKTKAPKRIQAHQSLEQELKFVYAEISKDSKVREDEIIQRYQQKYKTRFNLALGNPDLPRHRWKVEVIRFWGDNNLSVFNDQSAQRQ